MNTIHRSFDFDLVRKYNVAAPRYTSYPPATHFAEMSAGEVLDRLGANATPAQDVSLYFHLPFCQSLCWYCGCTTLITTQQGQSATYLKYLAKELALMSPHIGDRRVVQLHFGGGTPTFLLPDEIRELGRLIHSTFRLADDVEASVEVDPRRLTRDHVTALAEAGFRRASIGVQDFNPQVQKAVHRIQPKEMTECSLQWLRDAGFTSLNIDLIYGLPHQTVDTFEETLEQIIALEPDRLAIFNYAHVPWMKPAQKILEDALPSPETKLRLLELTIEKLTGAGFVYIGMDHFARADDELAVAQREKTLQRNFQGYSTRGHADIYAFGMSSISQANGLYWQNDKDIPRYYAALDAGELPIVKGYALTEDDRIRRHVIMRLMCDMGLDFQALSAQLGLDFTAYFGPELASLDDLEADGLLEIHPAGIEVTELGRLLIRNIAVRFDAYHAGRSEQRFSKSI